MAEGPGRQRLDPAARKRLLAEIARLDAAVRAGGAAAAAPAPVPPPDDSPAPATGPHRIKLRAQVTQETVAKARSTATVPGADRLPNRADAPAPAAPTTGPLATIAAVQPPVTAAPHSGATPQRPPPLPPASAPLVPAPAPPLTLQANWVPVPPSASPPADDPPPDLALGWIPLEPLPMATLPPLTEPGVMSAPPDPGPSVARPEPILVAARPTPPPLSSTIPAPMAANPGPVGAPTMPAAPLDGPAPLPPTAPQRAATPQAAPGPADTRPADGPDSSAPSAAADSGPIRDPIVPTGPQGDLAPLTSLPPLQATAPQTTPVPAATTAAAPLNSTPHRAPVMPPRPRRPPAQRVMVTPTPAPDAAPPTQADPWAALATVPVHSSLLDRNLIITAARRDPAHGAFDVLRTRMLQALQDNGWSRVGVTSPTKGCGKTFTALNLAVTLSRYGNARTVLLDLDLRLPSLATTLGVEAPGPIGDMLRGQIAPALQLRRFGANGLNIGAHLALGLNALAEPYPAELLHHDSTATALTAIREQFRPDVMLFDLPPVLVQDDVLALAPQMDAVLIVAGGGRTSARDVREAQRRLGDQLPVLGIVLNMAEGDGTGDYSY